MHSRIVAGVFGLVLLAVASPSARAAKFDKSDLSPFKGSYNGTLLVTSGTDGSVVVSVPATITFVPAKNEKSAVVTLAAPFTGNGVTYHFGGTFDLLKNRTTTVSDVVLGFAPGESFPGSGTFTREGSKEIALAESATVMGTTFVSTGTFQISKKGKKKQQMEADFNVSVVGSPQSYIFRFTTVGKAPR